jgi:type I restriction-modification system DNA methylase subunit
MAVPGISLSEAASLLGVQLNVVTNWAKRYPDFPDAVGTVRKNKTYSQEALYEWARSHRKDPKNALAVRDLQFLEPIRDLIFKNSAVIPEGDRGSRTATARWSLAVAALFYLERERGADAIQAALEKSPTLQPALQVRDRLSPDDLNRLKEAFNAGSDADPLSADALNADVLRDEFALLLPEESPDMFDSRSVNDMILALATMPTDVIYDPCCASGAMLAMLGHKARQEGRVSPVLQGQEIDPVLAAAALALLLAEGFDAQIIAGDVLAADGDRFVTLPGVSVTVVANPPRSGEVQIGGDGGVSGTEPRWLIEPTGDFTSLWVQHCLSHLPADGTPSRAFVSLAPEWLNAEGTRSAESRALRARLVRDGVVESSSVVPNKAVRTRESQVGILLLNRQHPADREVVMSDLTRHKQEFTPTGPKVSSSAIGKFADLVSLRHRSGSGRGLKSLLDENSSGERRSSAPLRDNSAPRWESSDSLALVSLEALAEERYSLLPADYLPAVSPRQLPERDLNPARPLPRLAQNLLKLSEEFEHVITPSEQGSRREATEVNLQGLLGEFVSILSANDVRLLLSDRTAEHPTELLLINTALANLGEVRFETGLEDDEKRDRVVGRLRGSEVACLPRSSQEMRALADKSDLETIEPLNVKYLAAYLSSLKVQDALWDIAQRSTSATISTISRGTISKLAVQVPSQERQLGLAAAWCEYQELLDRTAQFRRNLERWKARMLDPG